MDRLENLKNIIMYLMADEHVSHQIPSTLEERQRMMRALMNVWSSESIQACLEGRVATNEDEVNVWEPRPSDEAGCRVADAARGQRGGGNLRHHTSDLRHPSLAG